MAAQGDTGRQVLTHLVPIDTATEFGTTPPRLLPDAAEAVAALDDPRFVLASARLAANAARPAWRSFELWNASLPRQIADDLERFDEGLPTLWHLDFAYRLATAAIVVRMAPNAVAHRQITPRLRATVDSPNRESAVFFAKHPDLAPGTVPLSPADDGTNP